jgi:predicted lipoprotein with Yx(FWY)xxD motif
MRHTFSRTTLLALGAVAAAALGTVAAVGASMATASNHRAAARSQTMIGVKHVQSLGSILYAGPKRLTVYAFARDGRNRSTCTGACAKAWPPVTTAAKPKASGGANARDLAMIARAGGIKQVTYKGHPLYYFVGDKTSATAAGQAINGFGARWYVLSPSGREITTSPPSTNTSPTTSTTPSTTTTSPTTSTTMTSPTTTTPSTTTTSPSPGWG